MPLHDVGQASTWVDDTGCAGRRKAVLFCPECGHESPVDGDWVDRDDRASGTRTLCCPKCSRRLTDRPLPEEAADTGDGLFAENLRTVGDLRDDAVGFLRRLVSRRSDSVKC